MADDDDEDLNDRLAVSAGLQSGKNDCLSCELVIRYPTLKSIIQPSSLLCL